MVHSEPTGSRAAALVAQDRCRRHVLLLDDIVGQGKRSAEVLAAMGCAVLWKIRDGFKGEVCIGYQFSKGQKRSAVNWHTFIVKPNL